MELLLIYNLNPVLCVRPLCRFQVDLSSGCSTKPRSDVALHFSPRFSDSPCVVCNSLLQEEWGKEETLHQLPYKRGAPFETIILVHKNGFKVQQLPVTLWRT